MNARASRQVYRVEALHCIRIVSKNLVVGWYSATVYRVCRVHAVTPNVCVGDDSNPSNYGLFERSEGFSDDVSDVGDK